ncbi:hypothetical protein GCM10009696_36360 [Kocuria himachalensis]
MWWPAIIIGSALFLTGVTFVFRRHALAQSYAARRTPLPRDHPQYRAEPALGPGVFFLAGMVGILGGLAGLWAGIF